MSKLCIINREQIGLIIYLLSHISLTPGKGRSLIDTKGEQIMSTWEQFEIDCTRFLMEQFGEYATFIHQGRSDSTVPDIKVTTKKNKQFYIEAKHSPAQCGQFVLLPNVETRQFEYSRLNSTEINEFSQVIVDILSMIKYKKTSKG